MFRLSLRTLAAALVPCIMPLAGLCVDTGSQPTTHTTSRVESVSGVPQLTIAGRAEEPLIFFFNSALPKGQQHLGPQVELSAAAGVHVYSMPFIDWPWTESDAQPGDYSKTDALFDRYIAVDPAAEFIPRLWTNPDPQWPGSRQIPAGDTVTFADGSKGGYSDASDAAWELFRQNFRRLVQHYRATPYWKRIVGFHLNSVENAEWFHDSYREKGPDYCEANQRGFRTYLRARYQTDATLAAAWGRPGLTFEQARIPVPAPGRFPMHTIMQEPKGGTIDAFYALPGERDWVDYSRYSSELMAQRIGECARLIKDTCGGEKLSVFFYGYAFDTCGSFSGHLATGRVLRMPEVDLLAGPLSYAPIDERLGGGASGMMSAVDSVTAHGKLWMNEDDMRTHLIDPKRDLPEWLNQDAFGKQTRTLEETVGCLERNMANMFVHRAGTWWMDLIAAGSFQSPEVWQIFTRRAPLMRELRANPEPYRPEVAVIVDEGSVAHIKSDWDVYFNTLPRLRNACNKTGVALGFYYLDDYIEGIVPPCKAYVFASAFSLDDGQLEAIRDRLSRERATAIWQYAPGLIGPQGFDIARSRRLTGLNLELKPGKLGSRGNGALEGLAWGWDGAADYAVSPRLTVYDAKVETLGHYVSDGEVSAAMGQAGDYRSVFLGDFGLSADMLRKLFTTAGVHVWTQGGEVVHTDGRILAVHSGPGGEITINLPAGRQLVALEPAGPLQQQAGQARATFRASETRWFRITAAPAP